MNRRKRRIAEAWARKGDEALMPTMYKVLADGRVLTPGAALWETRAYVGNNALYRKLESMRKKKK